MEKNFDGGSYALKIDDFLKALLRKDFCQINDLLNMYL